MRRDSCEEGIHGDHSEASDTDDELGRDTRREPSCQESVRGAEDGEGEELDACADEAVAPDGLHVDVHVPEVDA